MKFEGNLSKPCHHIAYTCLSMVIPGLLSASLVGDAAGVKAQNQ